MLNVYTSVRVLREVGKMMLFRIRICRLICKILDIRYVDRLKYITYLIIKSKSKRYDLYYNMQVNTGKYMPDRVVKLLVLDSIVHNKYVPQDMPYAK